MRLFLFACILLATFSAAQELLWSDEFRSGTVLDSSVWSYDIGGGGWGNGELQEYTTDNTRVQDGNLIITVQQEEDGTITSGRIRSDGKLEFMYGTVEANIKVPDPSNGLWPSLWMLGASFPNVGWPGSGSLTIMQAGSASALALGEGKTSVGSAAFWEADGQAAYDSSKLSTSIDITADFHKYRLEWTPDFITTYIDGMTIFTKDISSCSECDEFHKPFFFVMNVAAGGVYNQIYDSAEITAPLPAEFVVDYIRIYDNGFTELSGSAVPPSPTVPLPTPAPTLIPTNLSTSVPLTLQPTLSPTDSPTTSSSTNEPTILVTPSSTMSPSYLPDLPSPETSPSPTSSPTIQLVSVPIQRFAAEGITMTLRNVEPLSPSLGVKWAEATGNHLASEMVKAMGPELVESVNVSVALVSQDPPFVGSRALEQGLFRALRSLQAEELELTFNAFIAIQSKVDVNDVNPYITGAFDSDAKNTAYVERLMATGDTFDDAHVVSVAPATSVSPVQAADNDARSVVTNIGLIVGMVAVALVICLVAFFVFTRRRKRKTLRPLLRLEEFTSTMKKLISTIEQCTMEDESQCSISPKDKTRPPGILDENLYTASVHNSQSGSQSGSQSTVNTEYDCETAFKNVQASVADSESRLSTYLSKDDTTLLNEFQVDVPAGKVGLVLETSHARDPVVQEVKASSPMAGHVQVGDRLLSVDGQDMSNEMAATVSRIIASKQHNSVRRFKFCRPKEK